MCDCYLFDVYEVERMEFKSLVRGKKVVFIVDELSDEEGRYVFNVMVVLLDFNEFFFNGNFVVYLFDLYFFFLINNKIVV